MAQRKTSKKTASRPSAGAKAGGAKSRSSKSSASSTGAAGGKKEKVNLSGVLEKIGVDESMVEVWRNRLSGVGEQIGEKVDLQAALDQARKLATSSADKIKKAGGKNPSLFYSGLAAIVVGAGLMTAARRGGGSKKSGAKKSRSGGSSR